MHSYLIMPRLAPWKDQLCSLLLLLGILLQGCGGLAPEHPNARLAASHCQPGVTEILVGDSFLEPVCGCTGPGEMVRVYSPHQLKCTVESSQSKLYFTLSGAQLPHQILPTLRSEKFPITAVLNAKGSPPRVSWPIELEKHLVTPGEVYEFEDPTSQLRGQIIIP